MLSKEAKKYLILKRKIYKKRKLSEIHIVKNNDCQHELIYPEFDGCKNICKLCGKLI